MRTTRRAITAVFIAAALLAIPQIASALGTWSTPVDVSVSGQATVHPQIVSDPSGTLAAIWAGNNGSNDIVQTSISTDHGATWSTPTALSAVGHNSGTPRIASDPSGNFAAIWARDNNIVQTSISTDHGITWSTPTDVSASGGVGTPDITSDGIGVFVASWSLNSGSNDIIHSSHTTDMGASWSAALPLSASGNNAVQSRIASQAGGYVTAIWSRNNGSNFIIQSSVSTDHGATWSTPVNLSTAGQSASWPQISTQSNATNTIAAIWYRWNGSNFVVQSSVSTDHGTTWSSPVGVSAPGGDAFEQQIAIDPAGNIVAIWWRWSGSNDIVQVSRSTDQGATWSSPIDLSSSDGYEPQLSVNSSAEFAATWYAWDGSNYLIQVATSADDGVTWTPAVTLSAAGQDTLNPQITSDPSGNFFAVWSIQGSVVQSSALLAPPTPPTPPTPNGSGSNGTSSLAATGFTGVTPIGMAVLLMLSGTALLLTRRRLRRAAVSS